MECSVCYGESGPFQTLTCGHVFCRSCIKTWYLKGSGTGCPMCRRPVYWRGFHTIRDQWDEEAWDTKCSEVFSQEIDNCFEEYQDLLEEDSPKWNRKIYAQMMSEIIDAEKTYRFLRSEGLDPEVIEDIFYYGDYYSDRNIHKWVWYDEPVKEFMSRYATIAKTGSRGVKRSRAQDDEVSVIGNLIIWCM